jgi:glutamate-1-semialdehyde 2,1-aminomutase
LATSVDNVTDRLAPLMAAERDRFEAAHPRSIAMAAQSAKVWRGGVPLHWMSDWASPVPIFAVQGSGSELTDVDGHIYADFCLGDTPSMFGHGEEALARALADQARSGTGFMLPTANSVIVGRLLSERFGLPFWQATTTATDANRAAIRWARAITGRQILVIFDGCYHGAVEDTFLSLATGTAALKSGLVGQVYPVDQFTRVIDFNDLDALKAALAPGDVAAVLAEPVMTNCGMIVPDPEFHQALRAMTREHGTLLILDETHTLSSGPGGYTAVEGLQPDMFTLGKAVAGGFPAAVWGMTADVAERMDQAQALMGPGYSGIGTTLSGNALAMAAMRAMLSDVMTQEAYDAMSRGAERLVSGLRDVIARRGASWSVVNVGARIELVFSSPAPRNARDMRQALAPDILTALHLWLINRGVLIAPFHNMMLVSPHTSQDQIDKLVTAVDDFAQALSNLRGPE